jgi:hypothetical protein
MVAAAMPDRFATGQACDNHNARVEYRHHYDKHKLRKLREPAAIGRSRHGNRQDAQQHAYWQGTSVTHED